MKTDVQKTSIEAYRSLKFEGGQMERVARLLLWRTQQGMDTTGGEVAAIFSMQTGTVSARMKKLKEISEAGHPIVIDFAEYRMKKTGERKSSVSDVVCEAWQLVPFQISVEQNTNIQPGQQAALFN